MNEQGFTDYSVVYKQKELMQLNKRLRRTRNIILIASLSFLLGGMLFELMPDKTFTMENMLYYIVMAILLACLAFLSKNRPYRILLLCLMMCIGFWGAEIVLFLSDELLIEGAIHKLIIISLLISGLHTSKEAELIKKELQFI